MDAKLPALLLSALVAISACGQPAIEPPPTGNPNDPMLQIHSEGGFAPIEFLMGAGPIYTLLAGGDLISQGPVAEIYPGPLLPNYQVAKISEDDMAEIRQAIENMGLAGITFEEDFSAAAFVADAGTTVVTYWDGSGEHVYSVYALGISQKPTNSRTAGFASMLNTIDRIAFQTPAEPYQPEDVRVLAGPSTMEPNPDFSDIRPWPLQDDLDLWTDLANGWKCNTFGPEVLPDFETATQLTRWQEPDPLIDAPTYTLLVRPLLPGEPECPAAG